MLTAAQHDIQKSGQKFAGGGCLRIVKGVRAASHLCLLRAGLTIIGAARNATYMAIMSLDLLRVAFVLALLVACRASTAYTDKPFLQPVPLKFTFDGQVIGNIAQLTGLSSAQQIVSITTGQQGIESFVVLAGLDLYQLDLSAALSPSITLLSSAWNVTVAPGTQLLSAGDVLLLLAKDSSSLCSVSHASCKPLQALDADVTAACIASDGTVYVGTNGSGVYDITPSSFALAPLYQVPRNASVTALAWDHRRGFLWVATEGTQQSRLAFFAPNNSVESVSNWQFFDAQDVALNAPSGLAFDNNGTLWVACAGSLSVLNADWQIDWLSGLDGVPMLNISGLYASPSGDVWAATAYGAWQYSRGRYKVPNHVF